MSEQIKRYDTYPVGIDCMCTSREANGKWVYYADHIDAVAAKDARIAELEQQLADADALMMTAVQIAIAETEFSSCCNDDPPGSYINSAAIEREAITRARAARTAAEAAKAGEETEA